MTHYLETRGRVHFTKPNMVADIMRHLYARQHLGKAVVVCDDPESYVQSAQRQWLKLSRLLQRRRRGTLNVVEIMKYTFTITQMQHVSFVAGTPEEQPEAQVYFVKPGRAAMLPVGCLTVYVAVDLSEAGLRAMLGELAPAGLVVDYAQQLEVGDFGLLAKTELEAAVTESWESVEAFLAQQQIDFAALLASSHRSDELDDALDALLEVSSGFLRAASVFQQTLDMARPLRQASKLERDRYELFLILAYRVQTLAPSGFSTQYLKTYADDTFLLHDGLREHGETLAAAMLRHRAAGRRRLAEALAAWLRQSGSYGTVVSPVATMGATTD